MTGKVLVILLLVQTYFAAYKINFELMIKAESCRQLSLTQAESIFNNHVNPLFLKKDVRNLSLEDANKITGKLRSTKSPAVFNKCLTVIKAVFGYAKKKNLITDYHFMDEEKYSEHPREKVLSQDEELRLIAALDDEKQIYKDIVLIALMTGQRKSCVLSMQWQEIDPNEKLWAIPASKAKSKKGLVVPLIAEVMQILKRRSAEAEQGEKFVFPNKNSKLGHVTEKTGEGSFWRRTIRRADLYSDDKTQRLTFHDLRRSTATRMARAGIDMAIIQKALGHSSIMITQEIYAHHHISQVRDGMELVRNKPEKAMELLKEQLESLTPEQRAELLGGDI
jgi:integrase